jgi:hypothetical protein
MNRWILYLLLFTGTFVQAQASNKTSLTAVMTIEFNVKFSYAVEE